MISGVGCLVPDRFKEYWNLTIDDVSDILESVLTELDKIDMFIHDSDHSYIVMSFEYNLAWNFLNDGRFLCSDDITPSNAFDEFTEQYKNHPTNLH